MNGVKSPTRVFMCKICAGPTRSGYSMCRSCHDIAMRLGRPPIPITPVAVVGGASPLYRALRQYKSGEPLVAARQAARLAALLEAFFARHRSCIAPEGLDLSVAVPSGQGGRPAPHPLVRVVEATRSLPPLLDALRPGGVPIAHRCPTPLGFRVRADVRGARILLVDDVYTSGAHLQSAAAALTEAGAHDVRAVVLGRFVRLATPRPRCPSCPR
jgi:hypothetical protein